MWIVTRARIGGSTESVMPRGGRVAGDLESHRGSGYRRGMPDRYLLRQAALAAVTANVLRPLPGMPLSPVSFFSGWLAGELAPQLMAAAAVDNTVHLARHGLTDRRSRIGLALGAGSLVGLGAALRIARTAAETMDRALAEGLGAQAVADLDDRLGPVDRAVPWRRLVNPFRMTLPGVTRIGNRQYAPGGRRTTLDVYRSADTPPGAPVLLQIHGGGWVIGDKRQQGLPLMQHLASRGWVCVAINYPLSPKAVWPEHLIAVKRAIAWIRENAEEIGADPSFLAVTGGSAGGHLTAMTALTANDPQYQPGFEDVDTSVQAAVPFYGVYDFEGETKIPNTVARVRSALSKLVLGKGARYPEDYRAASPLARLRADAPPMLVVHGKFDSLVPVAEAREFVRRLREVSQAPVCYAELAGAQHAFEVFLSSRTIPVVAYTERFLAAVREQAGRVAEGVSPAR